MRADVYMSERIHGVCIIAALNPRRLSLKVHIHCLVLL